MSYFQDDDTSQIRELKDLILDLQARLLGQPSSVTLQNISPDQNTLNSSTSSSRGGGSGGTGQTNPEIRPRVDHGTIGLVTENIDLSVVGGNFHKMILSDDISLAFTNPPVAGQVERLILEIKQDGIGGHDVLTWGTLVNPPILDTTANATTRIEIYTDDGGTTYEGLSVTTGSGGEFFGPWTATHDAGGKNLANLGDISFSEVGQSILSDPLGLFYNVPLLDEHVLSVSGVPKLTVGTTILAGTSLDMANLAINNASSLTVTTPAGVTVGTLLSTILPDTLKLDIPTNKSFIISEGLTTKIETNFLSNIQTYSNMALKIKDGTGDALDISFLSGMAEYGVAALDSHRWNIGGIAQIDLEDGVLTPASDDDIDLGKPGIQFKDLFIDGIANIDKLALSATDGEGVSSDINPDNDLFWNLGTSIKSYSNAYIRSLHLDDTALKIEKSGTLDMLIEVPSLGDLIIRENGTEFVRFDGNLNRSVFKRDLTIDNGRRIRAESTTEMGYFVTDYTGAIGSLGSLQVPWRGSTSSSKAGADSDFGAFNGSIAINEIAGTPILMTRKSDGSWWGIVMTSLFP